MVEITEEVRRAVLAAECESLGHALDTSGLTTVDPDDDVTLPDGSPRVILGADGGDKLAHIRCVRCGLIWLVFEDPFYSYEEAEASLPKRLKNADPLAKKISNRVEQREQRRKDHEARIAADRAHLEADHANYEEKRQKALAEEREYQALLARRAKETGEMPSATL